jgi:chromosome segregation ATPase
MGNLFSKFIGVLLIIAAIGGLIISAAAIAGTWQVKEPAAKAIYDGIEFLVTTLETTSEGLAVSQDAISASADSIAGLQTTLEATVDAIDNSEPMLDSISTVLTGDVPETIKATQTSLDAAGQSARIIDTVLRALTFLNRSAYNPEKPLHDALAEVSTSMDSIPESLEQMDSSITDTKKSMAEIQTELSGMALAISDIETSVKQFSDVISQYELLIDESVAQLEKLNKKIPSYLDTLALFITVFFVWMFIAQFGLLTQGWELIKQDRANLEEPQELSEAQDSES